MRVFKSVVMLLLAVPLVCSAYEVNILDGRNAQASNLEKGRYEVAIARLETRIQLEAVVDRDIALTNLCTAYVVTGQYEKAVPICDQAVAANGRYVGVAYNSRGVLHAMNHDYIAALDDFRRAADDRNYPRLWNVYAGADVERSIQIAARNLDTADRVWVSVRE